MTADYKLPKKRRQEHNNLLEDQLVMMCVEWFDMKYRGLETMLIHVANERKTKTITVRGKTFSPEGKKLKKMGVRRGVADFILLISQHGYGSLCLEMKVRKGDIYRINGINHIVTKDGTQSPEQHEWELSALSNGNKYVICRTFDEFKTEVEQYLI